MMAVRESLKSLTEGIARVKHADNTLASNVTGALG